MIYKVYYLWENLYIYETNSLFDKIQVFRTQQSSSGSENTVYNDVLPASSRTSISSGNTLYNDVIEIASTTSSSSNSTVYNDVIWINIEFLK